MQEIVEILILSGSPETWDSQINNETLKGWIVKGVPTSVVDPNKRAWVNIILLYREKE